MSEEERLRQIISQREDRIRSLSREVLILEKQVHRLRPFPALYEAIWSENEDNKVICANQNAVIELLLEDIQLNPMQKKALEQKFQYRS
jgi:hypothetical protein